MYVFKSNLKNPVGIMAKGLLITEFLAQKVMEETEWEAEHLVLVQTEIL